MSNPSSFFKDQFWTELYQQNQTRWDIGYPSPPLKEYIDQLKDKTIRVLIPGCGNAYEAEYLLKKGFHHVTLIDISEELVRRLREKFSGQPVAIIHDDFFHHQGQYDLVIEQTFFCALHPSQREAYASKMYGLLNPRGTLAGVLFDKKFEDGPPFGGSQEEYRRLFAKYFKKISIEPCYNSIGPREGAEVFIRISK